MIELALALSLTMGQQSDPADVTRELTQIVRRLGTDWKNGNCEAWGAVIAPEWSVIHITGTVITRSQAMEMCKTPDSPIETIEADELAVRAFGDAAVVTGRTTASTRGANPETATFRFTDVFVRRGGRWQIVASHATRVADSAPR